MNDTFMWIDIKTTGPDPQFDRILEVGWQIWNANGEYSAPFSNIVFIPDLGPQHFSGGEDSVAYKMHKKSGLLEDCKGPEAVRMGAIESLILEDLAGWKRPVILTGNSVDFDRNFVKLAMETLAKELHYRLLDMSASA